MTKNQALHLFFLILEPHRFLTIVLTTGMLLNIILQTHYFGFVNLDRQHHRQLDGYNHRSTTAINSKRKDKRKRHLKKHSSGKPHFFRNISLFCISKYFFLFTIIIDKTRQHRLNRKTGDKIDDSRGIQIEPAIPPTISEEVGEGILTQADRDDIQSHRLDDVPGIRRHIITKTLNRKVKLNKVAPVNPVSSGPSTRRNSAIDSEAGKAVPIPTHHEVFVELDELVVGKDNELQWKEKARWIKFEEDVEENEVWSEPVIGSLTFQSLWEVRKGIEKGVCLLDLEAISLPQIAAKVVNAMMNEDL
ncbi:unnamed protein product, partial [Oikopleura dioica]